MGKPSKGRGRRISSSNPDNNRDTFPPKGSGSGYPDDFAATPNKFSSRSKDSGSAVKTSKGSGGKGKDGKKGVAQVQGKGEAKKQIAFEGGNCNDNFNPSKGKGKTKGKKGKGKERQRKIRKNIEVPLEDADYEVPRLADRPVIQGRMDPTHWAKMRNEAIARHKEFKAQFDPATYKRQYKCHLSVTGIQNSSPSSWEVFMAVSMSRAGESTKKNKMLKANYSYSRSYIIGANQKKTFKAAEKVYTKMFIGSYKDLQQQELRMDLWYVVRGNFNQHLGVAVKNLYDCGCEPAYQTVNVKGFKSGSHQAFDLGIVYLSALVSEVFVYTISLNNWQFLAPAGTPNGGAAKSLVFKVPSGTGAFETFATPPASGPKYGWVACGQYLFEGTKVALSCAAFEVQLLSNGGLQGKAVISLGSAGEYPIAMGNLKCLTDNKDKFYQGKVGGGISLQSKSKLLKPGQIDEGPSIPAPDQPSQSVVMYNLDPSLQYLVVDVNSAEGLPVADFDLGTSHPFVRVRYDGVVQQSLPIEGTLRPVWNHIFYIPVRYIEEAIWKDPRYFNTLLPKELESKGHLEVEVWHMDGVPTEFLGAVKLDPRLTRFGEEKMRSICERMAKLQKANEMHAGGGDEEDGGNGSQRIQNIIEEEETQGIHPKLMKKQRTKVYGVQKQRLLGTRLVCSTQPKISFECCFLPDFPSEFNFPEQPSDKALGERFKDLYEKWATKFEEHHSEYYAWFPDSPSYRAFPCYYQDMKGDNMPLPHLVQALALPASLNSPQHVLHWVRCLEFFVQAKQKSKGMIHRWQTPEATLALRKGAVQDHAVLLCCALLGLRKDAWVVRGRARDQDHAWCMTREKAGYVTFWEATSGAKYHLPGRWSNDPAHGPKMKQDAQKRNASRKIIPDFKEKAILRRDGGRRVQLTDLEDLSLLPYSPFLELAEPKNIVLLPYDSIEVVFNATQLYGNKGNHHPGCIYYDFEGDEKSWEPLMEQKYQGFLAAGKGVAIPVGPAISEYTAKAFQDNIDTEVKESIRLTRLRKGYESVFDENEILHEILTQYLDVLEKEIQLDVDWMLDPKGQQQKAPGHASPFNAQGYVEAAKRDWKNYWDTKKALDDAKEFLPVKENHVLSGVPFHFSGVDIKEIRHHLMDCKPILEYLNLADDDVVYFCCSKVFPMANSVASVWCWIGVQMPLTPEEIMAYADEHEKNKSKGDKSAKTASLAAKGEGKGKRKAASSTESL